MILIDMSHLLMRNLYMNMKDIYDKETEEFSGGYLAHIVVQNVLSFARDFGASKENPCVIATDSKPSWRHEYYAKECVKFGEYEGLKYKGNRTKDDSLPWDKIWETYNGVLDGLAECSDFIVMRVDRAEADDIIAVLAAENARRGNMSYVISSDKDFKQLQGKNVVLYDPVKKMIIPEIDVERFMKVHIIAGDKGDNILAIKPRVGSKTAEKMLPELDDLLATDADMRAKYKFNQNLIDFDYIPKDVGDAIGKAFGTKHFNYNATEALKFCSAFRLQKIAGRINELKLKEGKIKTRLNSPAKGAEDFADATIESFFG